LEQAAVLVGGDKLKRNPLGFGRTGEGNPVFSAGLEAEERTRLEATGSLRIQNRSRAIDLAFQMPAKVRQALKDCERGLLKSWGFSPELQQLSAFVQPEGGNIFHLFTVDDYPESAVRREAQGQARVMVTVGVDGRSKACRNLQSSGHPDLDATTCGVLARRARFQPARDRAGRPIASPAVATVRWLLPD
jgi:TonB family protein